jgi:hypothetical protein
MEGVQSYLTTVGVVVEEAEERIDSVTNARNVITLKQELRHFWKKKRTTKSNNEACTCDKKTS